VSTFLPSKQYEFVCTVVFTMTHPNALLKRKDGGANNNKTFISHHDEMEVGAITRIQKMWRFQKRKESEDQRDWILLPILIIPGIASSGLIIEHSGLSNNSYAGQRVWMNAAMLATSRLLDGVLNEDELQEARKNQEAAKHHQQQQSENNTNTNNIRSSTMAQIAKEKIDKAKVKLNEARDTAKDKLNEARDTAKDRMNKAKDKFTEAKETVLAAAAAKLGKDDTEEEDNSTKPEESKAFHEAEAACQVRSAWLHHMSLSPDMMHERPGNRVRPYQGLDGCEYLSDDPMTQLGSWVHAPVTKYLTEHMGYARGFNLDGAPYDWRLPPSLTEERDQYLTQTMNRIIEMYEANKGLPVVLLCHSMGCKMGHYLLNFALQKKGRQWIDKYIHCYMPVGAPHGGVSLAVRAGVTGKGLNDQVDMLLEGDDEGLVLYRSWGSGAWLMPRYLPPHILPSVICRREGELAVHIMSSVPVGPLFQHRKKVPKELRLTLAFRGIRDHTSYVPLQVHNNANRKPGEPLDATVTFNETFYFAVPYLHNGDTIGTLQFYLEEPAGRLALNAQNAVRTTFANMTSWAPLRSFKKKVSALMRDFAKSIGACLRVGVCATPWELKVSQFVAAGGDHTNPTELDSEIPMCGLQQGSHDNTKEVIYDDTGGDDTESDLEMEVIPRLDQPLGTLHVKVRYTGPPMPPQESTTNTPIAAISPGKTPVVPIADAKKSSKKPAAVFDTWNGHDLLHHDGFCDPIWKLLQERYEGDPLGPTTLSALEAPPVKRIRSIYGINLQTEVCAVYRHRPVVVVGDDLADSRYVLDSDATFPPLNHCSVFDNPWAKENLKDYKMIRGRIFETPRTVQKVLVPTEKHKKQRRCCGDGTVPYWNLSHCMTWKDAVPDLVVDELNKAEHRGILADERFHLLLKQYCKIRDPRASALLQSKQRHQKLRMEYQRRGAGGIGALQATLQDASLDD
jgi:hypothetical protein